MGGNAGGQRAYFAVSGYLKAIGAVVVEAVGIEQLVQVGQDVGERGQRSRLAKG
jgi:hypothetical protein